MHALGIISNDPHKIALLVLGAFLLNKNMHFSFSKVGRNQNNCVIWARFNFMPHLVRVIATTKHRGKYGR
ncbi:hypothetical protein A7K93_02555 [Candidatus Methylacidiphilum fumarolicum]|uniref:Uncharacterized protein n=2 Tax=Candidatus Methylacidiphilum fumarolicum TaxID=591154 RepID=I0JVI9_METFB|nr:hypothetical protein A7K73_00650 [Candidatus Methylacidiphilum fumarolicum]CCG91258.1 hypothetical protein MFUM_1010082 [Methylacidiphilum fumariolicum SolV]TFE73509.1 hypothetical protein A7K72_06290 [Candidatus Methylacidiphilum fumarolicum]TFE75030.1 hypothetical protein A7K93_02555 [Candidatus Methylacidiphilum fumarolicum]TFE76576.1 hypothetical protein A7D33_09560 [Candidatus Methylacidiphilum fumarolicum]